MEVDENFCESILESKKYIRNSSNLDNQIVCSQYLYHVATNVPVESIMLAVIYMIGDFIAIVGNIFVIYAANIYGTFKLDKVTIMFVQNLAIADMFFILLYPIPMSITHILRYWAFGSIGCKIISYVVTIPGTANIYFILAVSLHRFLRCKWPTRIHVITESRARFIVIVTWVASCAFIAYLLALDVNVDFIAEFANCAWHFQSSLKPYHMSLMIITVALPILLTTALNIGLWVFVHMYTTKNGSKRRANSDKMAAVMTTSSITALFLLTWLPTVIDFLVQSYPNKDPSKATSVPHWAIKLRIIYVFGTWGNPIIYTIINRKFRDFVLKKIRAICEVWYARTSGVIAIGSSTNKISQNKAGSGGGNPPSEYNSDFETARHSNNKVKSEAIPNVNVH